MAIKRFLSNLLESYSYLLFSTNKILGGFLLALSFINPSAGIHALIAFTSASLFAKLSGANNQSATHTRYLYNSILTGLAIGYIYAISPVSLLFSIVVGILTFLFSSSLHAVFSHYLNLPILNLPFAIIATLVYLASMQYSSLSHLHNSLEMNYLNISNLPIPLQGLFRSLGVLLFLPYDIVGIALIILILILSRINFSLIIVGYFTGTMFHSLLSGMPTSGFSNPFSFNYILIALALGGFYLIPAKRTYFIALVGVCVSSILLDGMTVFWSTFGIPAFTLPFAITVLLFVHALLIARYPFITKSFKSSPEQNLEQWCITEERFGVNLPAPRLPFSGEWTVYQGFDDNWTHQGIWRYAVDFVIEDPVSKHTYRHEGKRLEEYYCFNKPVLSPVTGSVVTAVYSIADNPIGIVDHENNWGNHIVIYSDFGYYVELSHFAKDSILVAVGERVIAGQLIGRCGNSGYSPQPHIHMQVQNWAYVGAPAIPFTFSQAMLNSALIHQNFSPQKGNRLSPLVLSRKISTLMQFILDDKITFKYQKNGVNKGLVELVVKMDSDGSYYFEDTSRESRLYFVQRESDFLITAFTGDESSPIRILFTALPSIPFSEQTVQWSDSVPASIILPRLPFFAYFFKSFFHPLYSGKGQYELSSMTVTGTVTLKKLFSKELFYTEITLSPEQRFPKILIQSKGEMHELTAI